MNSVVLISSCADPDHTYNASVSLKAITVYISPWKSKGEGRLSLAQLHLLGQGVWLPALQTLFHKGRFRQEPYEWVYDGLKPLDMMDVLQTNKGISLTLAVSFLGVARHLGIPMSMVPIPEGIAALFCLWCSCAFSASIWMQIKHSATPLASALWSSAACVACLELLTSFGLRCTFSADLSIAKLTTIQCTLACNITTGIAVWCVFKVLDAVIETCLSIFNACSWSCVLHNIGQRQAFACYWQ